MDYHQNDISVEFYVADKWQDGTGVLDLRAPIDRRKVDRRQHDRRILERRGGGRRGKKENFLN